MENKKILKIIKNLYLPKSDTHKGQNGRLLIIGGSKLFHSASLWALEVASRIVDLVHYASVEENNRIVHELKKTFRNGIVISRSDIENYIEEDDCILIGPGMVRIDNSKVKSQKSKLQLKNKNLKNILEIKDEGLQTYHLTKYLLTKYPHKKWVIDAGALQMVDLEDIPSTAILTPHHKEFDLLKFKIQNSKFKNTIQKLKLDEQCIKFSERFNCTILLKGKEDIIAPEGKIEIIKGGNAGMTKGGTGDVLAGLVAAFYCKNDAFTSALSASFINKKAGEDLFKKQGYWFNASDLSGQIPVTLSMMQK